MAEDIRTHDVKVTLNELGVAATGFASKGITVQSIQYNYGTQPNQVNLSIPIVDENVISMPSEISSILTKTGLLIQEWSSINLNEKDYEVAIFIDDTKVFGGIVTDVSYSFSEAGHIMNITALDYRILLTRTTFFGEYNNKDNPASLPTPEQPEETIYKPRWTAEYILQDIFYAHVQLKNRLNLYNKDLSLSIADENGYFGAGENWIKIGSNAVDVGPIVFSGQTTLEAIQMVIQKVGNYKLFCDPDGKLWVTKAGSRHKIISCNFGRDVVSYDLSESANRNTSVLIKGTKYYFSGQKEISLLEDSFPNIVVPHISSGWVPSKNAFIVGMELTPSWTSATGDAFYQELAEPYVITIPDTGQKIAPLVVEEWEMSGDGKTYKNPSKVRPMTQAEGAFLGINLMLEGGIVYNLGASGIFRRWQALKNGERIGLWRKVLFEGTTHDLTDDGVPILSKLNESGEEENITLDTTDPFGQKLEREVSIGVDILYEMLYRDGDEVKGTIVRADPSSYTIDYLKGEVIFKEPITSCMNTIAILLPAKYKSRYDYISGSVDIREYTWKGENYILFTPGSKSIQDDDILKKFQLLTKVFAQPYVIGDLGDGKPKYWVPRVWATFYYKKDVPFASLTWTSQEQDDPDIDVFYAEEDNYVLIRAKQDGGSLSSSRMHAISTDKVWEADENNNPLNSQKGYYTEVGTPLVGSKATKDIFAETTYVFRHRDERGDMVKLGKEHLEIERKITGTVKLAGTADIALGPNLGKAVLSGHDRYSGEAFIEGANLSLTESGFFVTLELERERFRLGREPEEERKRKIDAYHRLGQWEKAGYMRILEPGNPQKNVPKEKEEYYDADP